MMKRYTIILSDHAGYADYHVLASDRASAIAKAVTEHCKNDSEDEREERQNKRSHQPEPIFSYRGWCKHAKR
ncbi:hypothetical protein JQC65_10695 [Escherichia coli]|uniref:hypothetical protein n=1 Tax=Enterobacteriaceae TaxID=543 RepID=UPI00128378F9|nr:MULTISPECIES: hypothetical protein [Enterobacteriaceae]KAA5796341.1 hypothetical protein F3G52_06645 [Klebsiella pneumoniae]MBZ1405023.1 hypothetical protein [Escherichia coli]MDS1022020.1 hypothetical protein [Klebsiella quasipneumoniae]